MMSRGTLRFAGYAGLFDIPDADRDVIRRGAFEQTLKERSSRLPLLWQHRPQQQIGFIEHVVEDERGLQIIAFVEAIDSLAAVQLRTGDVSGLSFGYRAREARLGEQGRELIRIDLFEVSLVTHPLQHGARVHLVH